ncbi:MAG: Rsd/AlgQ family anti-sigma factor [Pseudomonadales bacterium]
MNKTVYGFNDRFHNARQRLLSYLLKLGHAIDTDTPDLAGALTVRFCDTLVDYLATGHFQILDKHRPTADELAACEATTRKALAFSDRFGNGETPDLAELRVSLERLALLLDSRMDIEDEVLQRSDRVAQPLRASTARNRPATAVA